MAEYAFKTGIPPDREFRVLEGWQDDKQVAEANGETGEVVASALPQSKRWMVEIPAAAFEDFLRRARTLKLPHEHE